MTATSPSTPDAGGQAKTPRPPETAPPLEGRDLTLRYRREQEPVIAGESITPAAGRITALVGPNGSGKSTLLKALARQLAPESGEVRIDGRAIHRLPLTELARRLGILFQEHVAPGGLTTEQLVEHGRYPHRGFFDPLGPEDREAVDRAFELAGIEPLRHRRVSELSGGQKQLAWIAMVLAQDPAVLLLDEPTTFLDVRHQLEVMGIVRRLRDERGMTLVLVLHELNQAVRYSDHLVAMRAGRIAASGPPEAILTGELLREVFGVEAEILRDSAGHPVCVPHAVADPPGV